MFILWALGKEECVEKRTRLKNIFATSDFYVRDMKAGSA